MSSPTQRTREHCKHLGWDSQIVERWQSYFGRAVGPDGKRAPPGIRIDLFGVIDVLALTGSEIVGIQTTSTGGLPSRRAKIEAAPFLARWYAAGAKIEVWGWSKRGARGKRKLWTLTRQRLELPNRWVELPNDVHEQVGNVPTCGARPFTDTDSLQSMTVSGASPSPAPNNTQP